MANFAYPNSSVDTIVGLIQYDNSVTGGMFGIAILVSFFIIIMLALKTFEINKAFAGAAFVTAILGFLLRMMDVLADRFLWIPFVLLALSIVWLQFSDT